MSELGQLLPYTGIAALFAFALSARLYVRSASRIVSHIGSERILSARAQSMFGWINKGYADVTGISDLVLGFTHVEAPDTRYLELLRRARWGLAICALLLIAGVIVIGLAFQGSSLARF